jgi:hypothetical protein
VDEKAKGWFCERLGKDNTSLRGTVMIRVGAVNIDTSHPMGFADSMKKDGRMQYVGVYNDSFRNDKEVEGFIARYGLEKRCLSIEELAEMCDIGFIQGCNWDDHIRCAEPFIKKGKPVFFDKPAVGNLRDCQKIEEWIRDGAVIIGSSSARYSFEIQEFMTIPKEERGEIVTVYGTSGVDEFNYGIHIVEALGGILGNGAESVRFIGKALVDSSYSESWRVSYANGRNGIYTILTGVHQPFSITVMTTKKVYQFTMDSMRLYDALIEQVANFMEGKNTLISDFGYVLESVKIMLAGTKSRSLNGKEIFLSELKENDPSFDGEKFWKKYGAASGPMYAI